MKYCPNCGGEFFDTIETCSECNESLLNDQGWKKIVAERKMEDQEVFVKVKTIENEFEADIIGDALKKEDIPVLVRNFHDTSFDGLFIPQKGWGIILVPEEYREKAKNVIEEIE